VCGGLIDVGASAQVILSMLTTLTAAELAKDSSLAPRLIAACEERQQLALLQPWLAAREEELPPGSLEEGGAFASVREALHRIEPPKKGLWGLMRDGIR
jgi:hypothetical protein